MICCMRENFGVGKNWQNESYYQCLTCQLLPFVISCSYNTCSSLANIVTHQNFPIYGSLFYVLTKKTLNNAYGCIEYRIVGFFEVRKFREFHECYHS